MRKRKYHPNKVLHPIGSLGILRVSPGEIRVERLQDRLQPTVAFPHRHDFFQLVLVSNGSGWHEIDFEKHRVAANQVFLMKPGQVHSWSLHPRTEGFVIEFTRESLSIDSKRGPDLFNRISTSPDAFVLARKTEFRDLETVAAIMCREFHRKAPRFEACLQGYLMGLLSQTIRDRGSSEAVQMKAADVIMRFKDLVERSYMKEHRVAFYADALGVSPKALTMQLSRALDKSPRALIQERFVLEAKRLLAYSSLSVAEIGYELGFEDANYFTRFFRLHERMSPSDFRKRAKADR